MSRFVSGGTDENPTERDEAWLKAQQEIDARHVAKEEARKQGDGKSLYETLQANKAAKQDVFEESIRLSNQFRSLNEDEIEFLDSVNERSRARELEVKKETQEQLNAFRKQREEAEKAAKQEEGTSLEPATDNWAVGRKRKKGKERDGIASKLRRTSSVNKEGGDKPVAKPDVEKLPESEGHVLGASNVSKEKTPNDEPPPTGKPTSVTSPVTAPALGLGAYSSDEE